MDVVTIESVNVTIEMSRQLGDEMSKKFTSKKYKRKSGVKLLPIQKANISVVSVFLNAFQIYLRGKGVWDSTKAFQSFQYTWTIYISKLYRTSLFFYFICSTDQFCSFRFICRYVFNLIASCL